MKSPAVRLFAAAAALLMLAPAARAQSTTTLATLYNFSATDSKGSNSDGASPFAPLILGSDGNFYGTTASGGNNGYGAIFKLTPAGVFTSLYRFSALDTGSRNSDGAVPASALAQGNDGNFYGTTQFGGSTGGGTIFKVTPAGGFTNLHTFSAFNNRGINADGQTPASALVRGGDGNLYGTAQYGGANANGTIFKITPDGAFTTLYSFSAVLASGVNADGGIPAQLALGRDGNFYGLAKYGGANALGTIFSITPAGVFTTLHSFANDADGAYPEGALAQGSDGTFYGRTTTNSDNHSTIFSITPAGVFTKLYTSPGTVTGFAQSSLVLGSGGNLYGTTTGGGTSNTIFSLTPGGVLTTLYTFSAPTGNANPAYPRAALVQGRDGNLYGTTVYGGSNGNGTVYKLLLHPAFFAGEAALANGVYYLSFPTGNYFGYYSYLADPHYVYHFDLGFEYVFDANDSAGGIYLYDFASNGFFYTSPSFPFPYLYDFSLNSVVYYFPDSSNAGHYNTGGYRFFYVFSTGQTIVK